MPSLALISRRRSSQRFRSGTPPRHLSAHVSADARQARHAHPRPNTPLHRIRRRRSEDDSGAPGTCIGTGRCLTFAVLKTSARCFSACDQCGVRHRPRGECRRALRIRRGPATSDDPYGSTDPARLLAGTIVLEDCSRHLQESQFIALETEGQGADVLRNLVGQRE